MDQYTATVWTACDKKAKIRSMPSDSCDEYWHVPNWTQVYATIIDDIWAQICIGNFVGYIKRKYLLSGGDTCEDHSGAVRQHRRGDQ